MRNVASFDGPSPDGVVHSAASSQMSHISGMPAPHAALGEREEASVESGLRARSLAMGA